jgi:hypothetical protein
LELHLQFDVGEKMPLGLGQVLNIESLLDISFHIEMHACKQMAGNFSFLLFTILSITRRPPLVLESFLLENGGAVALP